ncbi:MAG: hypothetical protein ACXAAO_13750 [Candidatus Thorarchaeota archaeon]
MSDVEDSYSEFYGVSPRLIATIMILVTVIVPIGYIPAGAIILLIPSIHVYGTFGLFWFLGSGFDINTGFHFLQPPLMVYTLFLSIFNILYVLQVVKYYQGKTTNQRVLLVGAVSLIYPALLVLITAAIVLLPLQMIHVIWPIPIQFIIGLILLYKIPGPELIPLMEP